MQHGGQPHEPKQPGDRRAVRGRYKKYYGSNIGLLAPVLSGAERQTAVGFAILVHNQGWLVGQQQHSCGRRYLSEGGGQHAVKFVPILHSVAREERHAKYFWNGQDQVSKNQKRQLEPELPFFEGTQGSGLPGPTTEI